MKQKTEAVLFYKGDGLNAACNAERQDRFLVPIIGTRRKSKDSFPPLGQCKLEEPQACFSSTVP